jgi:hypothetical protein
MPSDLFTKPREDWQASTENASTPENPELNSNLKDFESGFDVSTFEGADFFSMSLNYTKDSALKATFEDVASKFGYSHV